jgi:hypothetical protein
VSLREHGGDADRNMCAVLQLGRWLRDMITQWSWALSYLCWPCICITYTQQLRCRSAQRKRERESGFQEVDAPRFQDNRNVKVVRLSEIRTGRFIPPPPPERSHPWYSFLLEAEPTPGSQCGWKDYVNEKFQWQHRESKPRPSRL